MSFSTYFNSLDIEALRQTSLSMSENECNRVVSKQQWTLSDLPTLLSPNMAPFLETMAQKSRFITKQRFGNTMAMFAPLYLSNVCYNRCTYCGFSMDLDYERVILSDDEIQKEAQILKDKGFQHVLVLTGEEPDKVGVDYIENAIRLIKPYFASIGLEIQPLKTTEYKQLMAVGVDTLTVYQETYHKESYLIYHLSGKKRQFDYRLETLDRGGEAGFYRLNLGALLGLYEWRYEAIALAHHVHYLRKRYWRSKCGVSFPRIKSFVGDFKVQYPVSDTDLLQYICVFRLLFPDLSISMSTREPAQLRDKLIHLGVTSMSAESHTEPGGYSGSDATCQFDISDNRSLTDVCAYLNEQGIDPVLKDWDSVFVS